MTPWRVTWRLTSPAGPVEGNAEVAGHFDPLAAGRWAVWLACNRAREAMDGHGVDLITVTGLSITLTRVVAADADPSPGQSCSPYPGASA